MKKKKQRRYNYLFMFISLNLLLGNLYPENLWDHISRVCGAVSSLVFGFEIIKNWVESKDNSQ